MAETLTYVGTLYILNCGVCGIPHAIPVELYNKAKDHGKHWYCPNGHNLVLTKTREEELNQEINALKNTNDYLRRAKEGLHNELVEQKHKVRAEKAAKTRIKNRVKHGVCPCCNRTFKQLAAHMEQMHPDYIKS